MRVSPMTLPISENAPAAKMPRPAPASASSRRRVNTRAIRYRIGKERPWTKAMP